MCRGEVFSYPEKLWKNLCLGLPELGHARDILFSLPGVSNRLKVWESGDLQTGSREALGTHTPFPDQATRLGQKMNFIHQGMTTVRYRKR